MSDGRRALNDWINAYIKYTEESEPPTSYHLWTAISIIAAALQRKVYMRFHMKRMYPNLFVVLVGPSGRSRKGTALDFGIDIIREIPDIRLCSQAITQQQLVNDLKNAASTFVDPTSKKQEFHCSMSIFSGELSVFLGSGNVDFLAWLTDLYDSHSEWEYRTKNKGKDKIRGVCLNFIGGTAPDWLSGMLPRAAIGGGFTSRIIFIVENDMGKIVPDPYPTKEQERLRQKLVHDLKLINLLAGEMKFEEVAFERYTEWYVHQVKNPPIKGSAFAGYCARRATHARKLSMILSAARSNEMLVRIDDFLRAVKILEAAEMTMTNAFSELDRPRYADLTEKVLDLMARSGETTIKHSELLKKLFPHADNYSLLIAMETLIAMRLAKKRIIHAAEGDVTYEFNL